MTHTPLTTQQHDGIDELYRDDVREPLEAAGWHETAEDCVVAPNGALWTEMTPALDSGIDAPDKAWSVAFDSNVPAPIIVAAALAAAGTDVPALLADNQHLRQQLAELEAYAYGCDAEGCVIPHSSWCEAAKKTAAENDGCTCPQPWKDSPQPHAGYCWLVSPPRAEVEEMRRALAEMRAKTLVEEADLIVAHCPQHGPRDQDGVWMDCHCPVADDMRHRAARPVAASEDTGR